MSKKSSSSTRKRPSLFVVAFGTLVGLIAVGYGSIMLFLHPVGIGPCRRNCGLDQAFLTFLGQPLYNLIFGMIWVVIGLALIVFLFDLRARK